MKSAAFLHYSDINLTILGFFLFVLVFVGVLVWTGLKSTRLQHQKDQQLPFNDGEYNA